MWRAIPWVCLFLGPVTAVSAQQESPLPHLNVRAIAVDPQNPSTVYAGTLERALLRSVDAGGSWTSVLGLPARSVSAINIRSGVLTVATEVGAFRSDDRGATWIFMRPGDASSAGGDGAPLAFDPDLSHYYPRTLSGGAVVNAYAADPFDPALVYAATDQGVFVTNKGSVRKYSEEWKGVSSGLFASHVYALAFDNSKSGSIYALTSRGLFFTGDGGALWSIAGSSRPPARPLSLAMNPSASVFYAGTDRGIFQTTDRGDHWDVVGGNLEIPAILAISVDSADPLKIYAGAHGSGVYKSTDGGALWRPANNGITGEIVGALALDTVRAGTVYAGTGLEFGFGHGVFKSADGGLSWVRTGKGLSATFGIWALAAAGTRPSAIYACTGDLFRSTDGGANWVNISRTEKRILTYQWQQARIKSNVHSIKVNPANPARQYAGGRDEIYYSADGGVKWVAAKLGTDNFDVFSLAIDPSNPDSLYAATGAVVTRPPGGAVFKSGDGGKTWTTTGQGLPPARFVSITVDATDARVVYAGSIGAGLFKSSDSGINWIPMPALSGQNVYALATAHDGRVYAGTANGIFRSEDRGATWVENNNGFGGSQTVSEGRQRP